jgi:hypothetical protein
MLPPRGSSQKGARRGPPVLQVAGMSPLTLLLVGMTSAASQDLPWPRVPKWNATWSMSQSTIFMPCNVSGMFDPVVAGRYGIADFDWSNGKLTPDGRGWQQAKPMDTNAVLIGQAAQVKAVNPRTHVWVYRQLVKALPWYREVGEKMADPRYSGWFLPFRKGGASDLRNGSWHVPPCTGGLCSNLYHSQDQHCAEESRFRPCEVTAGWPAPLPV